MMDAEYTIDDYFTVSHTTPYNMIMLHAKVNNPLNTRNRTC